MEVSKQSLLPSYLTQYEHGQTKLDITQEQFVIIKKRNGEARVARINNRDDVKKGLTNIKLLKYTMQANQNIILEQSKLNVAIDDEQIQAVFAPDQKIEDIQKLMSQDDMKEYIKSIDTSSKKLDDTTRETGEDIHQALTGIFQNIEKSKGERDKYHKTINNLEDEDAQKFMRKLLKYLLLKDKNTGNYRKDILGEETSIAVNGYTIEIKNGDISIIYGNKKFVIVEDNAKNKFFNIKMNSLGEDGVITINGEVVTQDNGTPYEPASQIDGRMMLRLLCAIVGCEEKPEEPEIDDDAERVKAKATITTIGKLSKDEALKKAEEEYQDMYNELRKTREENKSGSSNLESTGRLTRFSFNAKRIRQGINKAKFIRNRVEELMQTDANENDLFIDKGVSAANFHEVEHKYNINTQTKEKIFNHPTINEAVTQYINDKLSKDEFQKEINKLIEDFKNSNDPETQDIRDYFEQIQIKSSHKKNSEVSIAASNIAEKAEVLKAESALAESIINLYDQKLDFEEFKTQAKLMATEYINNYQKIPEIKALIDETAEDSEAQQQLMLKIKQKAFVFKKKLERGRIQIDLTLLWSENNSLNKAYAVSDSKLQNGLLEKRAHRVKNAHPARRRTARLGLAAAYGAGSVLTMGLANTAIAGTAVGVRKRRDYADQYKNAQEKMASDNNEREKQIQEREEIANDTDGKHNKIQKYMAKKQLKLYKDTLQTNTKFTEDVTSQLSKDLLGDNKEALLNTVTDTMARLRLAQDSDKTLGINFLMSKDIKNANKEYDQLHKTLDLALEQLEMDGTDIYNSQLFEEITKDLEQEGYDKLQEYKEEKETMGRKYGLTAGALHGAFSAAVQFDILGYIGEKTGTTGILGSRDPTGRFGNMKEDTVIEVITGYTDPTVINTPDTYGFDSQIDADMHRIYGADYNNIKTSLDQLKNSGLEYNWTEHDMLTLKKQLAESFKEGIVFKPVDPITGQLEIVKLATDSGNLISNLDKGFVMSDDIFQKTLQSRYGNISPEYTNFLNDQTQLTEVMKGIVDGSVDPMTLPEHQRRIAAEAFYQFFHDPKDITQLYFDTTHGSTEVIQGTPILGEEIIKRQRKSIRDRAGFPTFWQTVMRRSKKGLEDKTPKGPKKPLPGTIVGPGGRTIIIDRPKFYENPETIKDKPKAKPGYTRGVSTRGQQVNNDIENMKENFPENFKEKTSSEIADIIINMNFPMPNDLLDYNEIMHAFAVGDKKKAKKLLTIELERAKESNDRFLKETQIIEKSLDAVTNTLTELGLTERELGFLPKKEQIHVVPELEFWATLEEKPGKTMGVRYTMSGEIFVNCNAMGDRAKNPDITKANLTDTIVHEIIHNMGVNNYWKMQERNKTKNGPKPGGKKWYEARRVGMMMFRREKDKHGNVRLKESGRARNEALTNRATYKAMKKLYKNEVPQGLIPSYTKEEEVLKLIEKNFNITEEEMLRPLINRKATDKTGNIQESFNEKRNPLRIIKEKIEGRKTIDGKLVVQRPHLMDLIMGVMDYEEDSKPYGYKKTKELINLITGDLTEKTKTLTISKEMQKYFRKGVFDNKGLHALEIEKAYSFIKIEGTPQPQSQGA